jgi:predicted transglutaminase-like cysteine proteinase
MAYRLRALLGALGLLAGTASPALADGAGVRGAEKPPAFMRVYGQTPPPYGFLQLCDSFPSECEPTIVPADDRRLPLTPERLSELDEVNRLANRTIQPATDLELYGVAEWWTLPVEKGDCEDYALLKRHILIARGWPSGALLMTVVKDEKGEGHAVLTARTSLGDFILDNKVDDIKPWDQTSYQLVMRQSYIHPRVWMSLDPRDAFSPGAIAGVKRGW